MKDTDGRKLDHKTLEELRIRAVQRVEAGESPEQVIRTLGFSRGRIYEWLAAYREGGYEALKARRLFGRPPKLDGPQLKKLYRLVTEHSPLQLKFEFALWDRGMVRALIRREFDVRLSEVSVGRLLRKLGLSPQKPLHRAYQQDPQRVAQWKEETYPQIKALARKEKAEIFFADEATVRSDHHSGKTWAPVGETPVVRTTGARFSLNLVSAVSAGGSMRFMTFKGGMNAGRFIEFLDRLLVGRDRPIFLIVDGHPVHRSKKVREHVESLGGKLRLFFLPPYSPELNPDELVWNHLKNHSLGRSKIDGPDQFVALIRKIMKRIQRTAVLVKSFFGHPDLGYLHA